MTRKRYDKTYVFSEMPVGSAVAYLVVPTILTQVIAIIYNLADTYFIGQLGDPALAAAVGVCLPPMMLFTALANLFGVGASSVISRSLGAADELSAQRAAAFALWAGFAVAVLYILAGSMARGLLIDTFGGGGAIHDAAAAYLALAFTAGGVFAFASALIAHLLRSVSKAAQASVGIASGSVINIVLDPILIFWLGLGIEGAALATLAGQVASVAILLSCLLRDKDCAVICPVPSRAMLDAKTAGEVLSIGFVSFCMTALAQVSNSCVNLLVSPHGEAFLAASSVAIKLNIAAFAIAIGLSSGVLPIIGYNYGAGNAERVKASIRVALVFSLCVSALFSVLVLAFPDAVIRVFIDDAQTVACGRMYLREVALCFIPSSLVFLSTSYLQAIGQKKRPLVLAFTRMGTVDVLLMSLCATLLGPSWILLGKPLADWLCLCISTAVLDNLRRRQDPFSRSEG